MDQKTTNKILHETEAGYDLISKKFSQTRKHFWRELEFLKDFCAQGNNVLDFGCGNGRLLELIGDIPNVQYHGLDVSQGLIDLARQRYFASNAHFDKISPSQTSLAFQDNFFNTIYSIAVFHHFPSKNYRREVAAELYRTTNNGGHIIITVWYLWQPKYLKNILRNWREKIFETLIRMSGVLSAGSRHDSGVKNLDWNDCAISFTDNEGKKFQRFHHAFTKHELKRLFKNAGFAIERCEVVGGRNIILIGKKIQKMSHL